MVHHTKDKGDLAVAKTIADLTEKGYAVLTPLSEHLPFDLVSYDGCLKRIQVKHSSDGEVRARTSWSDKHGNHRKKYNESDFDYYAIYIPEKNVVCYPSIKFKGITLRFEEPRCATPFYWYEDFLDFTDEAQKKTFRDFDVVLMGNKSPKPNTRKVIRPSKEELSKLLWEKPMSILSKEIGVSDKAIAKWAKAYGISPPPMGYWRMKKAG